MVDLFLFRTALKDLMHPKKLVGALVLIALPTLIAVLWRTNGSASDFKPEMAYNTLSAFIVFGFILVILSVIFSTGVIAQEIEQKTIVYLLTRPVPRWRIILMKFLAAALVTTAIVWAASLAIGLVTYGPGGLHASRLGRDLLILPIGALAYGALFLLLATLFNRPLIYGLLFAFGWESWVPDLPGQWQKLSLMSYLHALAPHANAEDDASSALQVFNPETISMPLAWGVLSGVCLVALIAALIIFSTNEYVPREDAE
jgi:ABC-2 type transport system permease protein